MSETILRRLFVSCPKGVERLLRLELEKLAIKVVKETVGGLYVEGQYADIYRICLYSRLANRVILLLVEEKIQTSDELYFAAKQVAWSDYFSPDRSFKVDFIGTNKAIRHSQFAAMRVKDALVDHFYEKLGQRPNVDTKNNEVTVYAHLRGNRLNLGFDVSGGSLHRRHYRLQGEAAPLKENLAAALIQCSDYQQNDTRLVIDPMCGSGTLLIEAVLHRLAIAPALLRPSFAFEQLAWHKADQWQAMKQQAMQHQQQVLAQYQGQAPLAIGFDQDQKKVQAAMDNARRAGLDGLIEFKQQALQDFQQPSQTDVIMLTNPPYGERLSDRDSLFSLYQLLGKTAREKLPNSKLWLLCSDDYLLKALALQKSKSYRFYNGALAVDWVLFDIYQKTTETVVKDDKFQQGVTMVENRLTKNHKQLKKWREQNAVQCYRIYDADMPEYAFALDCYGDFYQLTEYQAPKTVDAFAAYQRRQQFEQAVKNVFAIPASRLLYKQRKQQKGHHQYEKLAEEKHFFTVREGNANVLVNLTDYLDTGLFLDHRPVRLMLASMCQDKRFLNLFCYTAVATVHAALGGAKSSLSLDMSNTYLDWARRNFRKNRLDLKQHQLDRQDILEWLKAPTEKAFDVIFMDPPSFSNSKKMQAILDIQKDHGQLIEQAMALLAPDGCLIFSNNYRDFVMQESIKQRFSVSDISAKTIDKDFQRQQKIHHCFIIRHLAGDAQHD